MGSKASAVVNRGSVPTASQTTLVRGFVKIGAKEVPVSTIFV